MGDDITAVPANNGIPGAIQMPPGSGATSIDESGTAKNIQGKPVGQVDTSTADQPALASPPGFVPLKSPPGFSAAPAALEAPPGFSPVTKEPAMASGSYQSPAYHREHPNETAPIINPAAADQAPEDITYKNPITQLPGETFNDTMRRAAEAGKHIGRKQIEDEQAFDAQNAPVVIAATGAPIRYAALKGIAKAKQAIFGGDEQILGHPEDLLSDQFQKDHPYAAHFAKAIGAFSSPETVAMGAGLGTKGLPIAERMMQSGFAASMISDLGDKVPEFKDAINGTGKYTDLSADDRESIAKGMFFDMMVDAGMATAAGEGAVRGEAKPATKFGEAADKVVAKGAEAVGQKVSDAKQAALDKAGLLLGRTDDFNTAFMRMAPGGGGKAKAQFRQQVEEVAPDLQAIVNEHKDTINSPGTAADAIQDHLNKQNDVLMDTANGARDTAQPVVPNSMQRLDAALDAFFDGNKGRYGSPEAVEKAKQAVRERWMQEKNVSEPGDPLERREPNLWEAENVRRGLNDATKGPIGMPEGANEAAARVAAEEARKQIDESFAANGVENVEETRASQSRLIDIINRLRSAEEAAKAAGTPGILKHVFKTLGTTGGMVALILGHTPIGFSALIPATIADYAHSNLKNPNFNAERAVQLAGRNPNARAQGVEPSIPAPSTTAPPPVSSVAEDMPVRPFDPELHAELASRVGGNLDHTDGEQLQEEFLNDLRNKKMRAAAEGKQYMPTDDERDLLLSINKSKAKAKQQAYDQAVKQTEENRVAAEKVLADKKKEQDKADAAAKAKVQQAQADKDAKEQELLANENVAHSPVMKATELAHEIKGVEGRTSEQLHGHENGHIMANVAEGLEPINFLSEHHPDAMEHNAAAAVQTDVSGAKEGFEGLEQRVVGILGGPAFDEAHGNLPINRNIGARSDIARARQILREEGGLSGKELDTVFDALYERAKEHVSHPEALALVQANMPLREAGLHSNYHMSPGRLQEYVNKLRGVYGNGETPTTPGVHEGNADGGVSEGKPDNAGGEGKEPNGRAEKVPAKEAREANEGAAEKAEGPERAERGVEQSAISSENYHKIQDALNLPADLFDRAMDAAYDKTLGHPTVQRLKNALLDYLPGRQFDINNVFGKITPAEKGPLSKANVEQSNALRPSQIPPERSTGNPETDAAIKAGGGIPGGNFGDLAMFHSPQTGSTLALKHADVTPERVAAHIEASDKLFKPEQKIAPKAEQSNITKEERDIGTLEPHSIGYMRPDGSIEQGSRGEKVGTHDALAASKNEDIWDILSKPGGVKYGTGQDRGFVRILNRNPKTIANALKIIDSLPNEEIDFGYSPLRNGGIGANRVDFEGNAKTLRAKVRNHFLREPEQSNAVKSAPEVLQTLKDQHGVSDDAKGVRDGASFITPEGQFIHLKGGMQHPEAIEKAGGPTAVNDTGSDTRPKFLNESGAIRSRFRTNRAGDSLSFSVPPKGVTAEQVDAMKRATSQGLGRYGNLTMERTDVSPSNADTYSRSKEFPTPAHVDEMLRKMNVHPDQVEQSNAVKSDVAKAADEYNREQGRAPISAERIPHSPEVAKRIADAYDQMQHNPNDPKVKAAYDAAKGDIDKQWDYATQKMGVKFEPWDKEGQPYANSKEMVNDVNQNKHLSFFRGGDLPPDHPMMQVDPKTGFTYNEKMRAVHDLFGHAAHENQFGPKGEENAWNDHRQMFSKEALPAVTTETRGQNSWVNFGKHLRDAEGNVPAKGEVGYVPPTERPYAQNKAGILPEQFHRTDPLDIDLEKHPAGGVNPETGSMESKRYGVEISPEDREVLEHKPTAEDFHRYANEHQDILKQHPDLKIGWDTLGGKPELNIGISTDNLDAAKAVGTKLDQRAIWDTQKGEEIPTGGANAKREFPDYPFAARLADIEQSNAAKTPAYPENPDGFEHIHPKLLDLMEPDEKAFVKGDKRAQTAIQKSYDGIKPTIDETKAAIQAGGALGGWWQRFINTFQALGEPTEAAKIEQLGPAHAEALKAWHSAVSGNKSVEDANRTAWGTYADWLDAGRPKDRETINKIVAANGKPKGNAAISDTLDKNGNIANKGLDTSKLYSLINSPQMRDVNPEPFHGSIYDPNTPSPVAGVSNGARKIPSMAATVAGKGNLNRLVLDAHMLDFYGENGWTDNKYIAHSIHLREAAKELGLSGGEGQEQIWGTVLGIKRLLREGVPTNEIPSELTNDVVKSIGKDYADIIREDPELNTIFEQLKKHGIDPGGTRAQSRLAEITNKPAIKEAGANQDLLANVAERIRGRLKNLPEPDDTSFNFGSNVTPKAKGVAEGFGGKRTAKKTGGINAFDLIDALKK